MSLEKAKVVADIVKIASDIYGAFADRKKQEDKDRRIKELETEVERLKAGK